MARPERNNVDYFPFYCEDGKKMYYLEDKYGNDGFATFIKLLRELAKAEYHYLNLSNKTTVMFLSAKCKVSIDVLESIISDLVDLEKFDREMWVESKVIWCQDFVDSIQDAYNRRNNKCITYEGLCTLLISLGIHKPSNCILKGNNKPQSKVEYSKEKKSKVILMSELSSSDDEIEKITFYWWKFFKQNLIDLNVSTRQIDKAKVERWVNPIKLMIEKDKVTKEELREVFNFVQNSDFWKTNVKSTSKLREQFTDLLQRARTEKNKSTAKDQPIRMSPMKNIINQNSEL